MSIETVPVVLATTNPGKVAEFRHILTGLPGPVLAADEAGLLLDVDETGATFAANARLKAAAYQAAAHAAGLRCWLLADDSGLEVEALGGEPGIYSTRWAGDTDATGRNRLLLARLVGVPAGPARAARFRCVIALIAPDGREFIVEGTLEGEIALAPTATPRSGFGYDPIFYLPDQGCTVADLPPGAKNVISHRGVAGAAARAVLERET